MGSMAVEFVRRTTLNAGLKPGEVGPGKRITKKKLGDICEGTSESELGSSSPLQICHHMRPFFEPSTFMQATGKYAQGIKTHCYLLLGYRKRECLK